MSLRTSTLVVFGDSLSDNGNLFDLIGIPQPPAWEGRVSNGPTYVEQLASFLHMRLDDRAFAGAEASDASPPLTIVGELEIARSPHALAARGLESAALPNKSTSAHVVAITQQLLTILVSPSVFHPRFPTSSLLRIVPLCGF